MDYEDEDAEATEMKNLGGMIATVVPPAHSTVKANLRGFVRKPRLAHRWRWRVPAQERLCQINELICGEVVAFNVGGQLSLPIDDRGMERVIHEAFFGKIVDPEEMANPPHGVHLSCKEVPRRRIGVPTAGVLLQYLGRVVIGVEGDREQDQVATELRREPLLKDAEVVGDA